MLRQPEAVARRDPAIDEWTSYGNYMRTLYSSSNHPEVQLKSILWYVGVEFPSA